MKLPACSSTIYQGRGKREIEIQSEQLVVEQPISLFFSPLAKTKCVHIGQYLHKIRAYGTNCLYMAGARNETEEEEEEGDIKGIG